MKNVNLSQKLTESGLMLALATILSVLKIAELPYGGSITFASMLPLIILSYRYGIGWGLLSGFVYGLIQMALGLNAVSYATTIVAAGAIIVLDYLLAFMTTALGGVTRGMRNGASALGLASALVCVLRYGFHVVSGCTVWAGLSIPTADAFVYSLIYNATYMIPETIVTVAAAVYIGSLIDFSAPKLMAVKHEKTPTAAAVLSAVMGLVILLAVDAAAVMVFPHLQNAQTGTFDITGIANANLTAVLIVIGCAAVAVIALGAVRRSVIRRAA